MIRMLNSYAPHHSSAKEETAAMPDRLAGPLDPLLENNGC